MSDRDDPFARQLADKRPGALAELVGFLKQTRRWWLYPIAIAVLLLGALVLLSGSGAAPFIYTLF